MTKQLMTKDRLRSRYWFDNPDNPGTTALCLERYMNQGVTLEELTSGRPIIGICQSGSDLAPCNRHHIELVKRVKDGVRAAGGVPSSSHCIRFMKMCAGLPRRWIVTWPI